MQILHAIWLPDATDAFVQTGSLRLWAETLERDLTRRGEALPVHPFHLTRADWPAFLEALGLSPAAEGLDDTLATCTLQLPSTPEAPLPSPPLARYWPADSEDSEASVRRW